MKKDILAVKNRLCKIDDGLMMLFTTGNSPREGVRRSKLLMSARAELDDCIAMLEELLK